MSREIFIFSGYTLPLKTTLSLDGSTLYLKSAKGTSV
jgi:hypothetical protein